MRSLELRAYKAVVTDGHGIPIDVAVRLAALGMDVEALETRLIKMRDMQ